MSEDSEEHKKCKVIKKIVVGERIAHKDYKECLFNGEEQFTMFIPKI